MPSPFRRGQPEELPWQGPVQAAAGARMGLQSFPARLQEAVQGVHPRDHRAALDPGDHGLGHACLAGQLALGEAGSPASLTQHSGGIHSI
jgi:hypothetical protein